MRCTPWKAVENGTSVIAQETEAMETYTAYEMTYDTYILANQSYVEFKYKK